MSELLERVLWQCEANACAIRALHDTLNHVCKELHKMSATQQTLAFEETAIAASIATLTSAVSSASAEITSLAGSISALTSASAGGTLSAADTATLSGFASSLGSLASNLNTAVASASPPASATGSTTVTA